MRIKTDRATQVLTVADGDANTPGMQEFSPRPGGLEHQTPREVTAQSLPHREDAELLGPTERPPTMKSTAATGGEVSFVAFDGLRGMLALWVAIGHFTYFSAWHNNLSAITGNRNPIPMHVTLLSSFQRFGSQSKHRFRSQKERGRQ